MTIRSATRRTLFRLLGAWIAFAWIAPLTAQEKSADPAQAWCEKARALVDADKLVEAEKAYREAAKAFEQQAAQQGNAPEFLARSSRCRINKARVAALLERFDDAEKQYQATLADLQAKIKQHPSETALWLALVQTHDGFGQMYRAMERGAPALAQFEEASRLARKLAEQFPKAIEFRAELATVLDHFAAAQINAARYREAEFSYREDLQVWHKLIQDDQKSPEYRKGIALAFHGYGQLARESGRFLHARDLLRSATQALEPLAAAFPDQPKYWQDLPLIYRHLCVPLDFMHGNREKAAALRSAEKWERRLAQLPDSTPTRERLKETATGGLTLTAASPAPDARGDIEKLQQHAEQKSRANPDVPAYRYQLVASQVALAMHWGTFQSFDKAIAAYRDALDGNAALVKQFSQVPKYRKLQAATHVKIAMLFFQKDDQREGEKAMKAAYALFRKMAEDFPDEPALRCAEDEELSWLLRFMLARDDYQRVLDIMQTSDASLKKRCADYPRCPLYRHQYAAAPLSRGHLLMQMKNQAGAEEAYRTGVQRWGDMIADFPEVLEYNLYQCRVRSLLITVQYRKQAWAPAEAEARAMVKTHQKLIAAAPEVPYFHAGLAMDYAWLAALASGQKKSGAALEHYSESIRQYEKAFTMAPGERENLDLLCKSLRLRGDIHQQNGDFTSYQRDLERSRQLAEWLETPFARLSRIQQRIADGKGEQVHYEVDDLFQFAELSGAEWFELAGLYGLLLQRTEAAQKERYASRAVASLRKALENGFLPPHPLNDEKIFQPLQGRADYQQLASVRAKQD